MPSRIAGPCPSPGCPNRAGQCDKHRKQREQIRGTSTQRGYSYTHQQRRKAFQTRMDAGQSFTCWRCHKPIDPTNWTLGHCDNDRAKYHGPECPPCDYATAGRTACPHPSHA